MEPGVHEPFRRLLITLAYLGALAVTIAVPAIYFATAYYYETTRAKNDAKVAANIVNRIIYTNPDTWRYQTLRMEEAISHAHAGEAGHFIRVEDDKGKILFQLGEAPPAPEFTFASDLIAGPRIVGKLEYTESFGHIVVDTALVSLLGLVLGLFTITVIGLLPIKALNRAARSIEASQKALRESEERFKAIVNNVPGSISLKDLDGRFLLVNEEYYKWLGDKRQVVGKTAHDLHPAEFADQIAEYDRKVLETGTAVEREFHFDLPDGTERTGLVVKFPIPGADGQPIAIGSVETNLTEYKRLKEHLAETQKMTALGQVAGGVAHEFNNMLQAVTNCLGMLELEISGSERSKRLLEIAQKAAQRGGDLTVSLLSYVGKRLSWPELTDLDELLVGVDELFRATLGEKFPVEALLADGLWPVTVDRGQLQGALLNLALNARDAMPGGGKITLEAANVSLDGAFAAGRPYKVVPGDYVKIAVKDTGTGMAPEVLEQAFQPFFTTKEVGQGTGLGLSMVFGFVTKQSGGHIDIDSEEGDGTTVSLYLPRAEAGVAEAGEEIAADFSGIGTVLVVEDDTAVLESMATVLESMWFTVLKAETGAMAFALLQEDEDISLVLADVVLPGDIGGGQLARGIERSWPSIKVILMSGHADAALAKDGVREGNLPFLRKPISNAELVKTIKEVLGDGGGK